MQIRRAFLVFTCAFALLAGDADAKGGRSSFSSGSSKSFSAAAPKKPSTPVKEPKAFSAPEPSKRAAPPSQTATPAKAPAVQSEAAKGFDSAATKAQAKAESQARFQADERAKAQKNEAQRQASKPKAGQTTQASSQFRTPPDPQRATATNTAWKDTSVRRDQLRYDRHLVTERHYHYGGGYDSGPNVFFWMWLMQNQNNQNDLWLYHHRDRVDPRLYDDLRARDAKLDDRLAVLEKQGVQRDPNFKHPTVDEAAVPPPPEESSFWTWVWAILGLGLAGSAFYYIFFVHRFGGQRR